MVDLIVRTFQYNKYKLTLVGNYTDVHTWLLIKTKVKTNGKQPKMDMQPEQIAQKYLKFLKMTRELNMSDYKPKATGHPDNNGQIKYRHAYNTRCYLFILQQKLFQTIETKIKISKKPVRKYQILKKTSSRFCTLFLKPAIKMLW